MTSQIFKAARGALLVMAVATASSGAVAMPVFNNKAAIELQANVETAGWACDLYRCWGQPNYSVYGPGWGWRRAYWW